MPTPTPSSALLEAAPDIRFHLDTLGRLEGPDTFGLRLVRYTLALEAELARRALPPSPAPGT